MKLQQDRQALIRETGILPPRSDRIEGSDDDEVVEEVQSRSSQDQVPVTLKFVNKDGTNVHSKVLKVSLQLGDIF
jgi:hypothetical protein